MQRTRSVLTASVVLTLGISSFAVAGNGDPVVQGKRNGTTTKTTSIVSNVDTNGTNLGYGFRSSNTSNSGGSSLLGCRSTGGTAPCLNVNNTSTGAAFDFKTQGPSAGRFLVGNGGDGVKPFTTNATGVAEGLNADRVDGRSAAEIVQSAKPRWLLVNSAGQIERQSGGFSIIAAYPTTPDAANGNVYIAAGEDLTDNGITATIALQNQVNQQGGTMNGTNGDDGNPSTGDNLEFSGEISATQCQLPGLVACAPEGARNANSFVVSPRLSDGQRTTNENRKRFYVMITP